MGSDKRREPNPSGGAKPFGSGKPVGSGPRPLGSTKPVGSGPRPLGSAKPVGTSGPARTPKPAPGARPAYGRRPAGTVIRTPSGARPTPRPVSRPPEESTGLTMGARRLALEVLRGVHEKGAYAALALNQSLATSRLSPIDRRLVTSIVYGVLENQIKIDFALDRLMEHPTRDIVLRDILRLSACQILFHDRIPDSAAVNEGVKLAKAMDMEGAAGFLNAVLRNLVRGKDEIPWPKEEDDYRTYLHVMGSMPLWIVDRLTEAYGPEEAKAIAMHRAQNHPMVVRPNMLRLTDAQFETLLHQKVWQVTRGLAPHAYLVSGAAEITLDRDYQKGMFSIQGQSSMLAAEAVQAKPGMKVLDACAAPGGKSAYLCEAMQGTGRVYAWELHEKRAMLLESTKRRLGLENLRISVRDAAEPKPEMEGTLDAVLLDAPCSGLGVMVEKPDLKYRVQPGDIEPIVSQQKKLLEALCRFVKPGGLLVYSTCSILPEENAEQIASFLNAHPEFTVEPLPVSFPQELRLKQNALGLQLLGYRDEVEGFYIVRLRKARA